jgi:hypothetical protein
MAEAESPGMMRNRLVQQRQPVTHRSFGGPRNQRKCCRFDRDFFLLRDPARCAARTPVSIRLKSKR